MAKIAKKLYFDIVGLVAGDSVIIRLTEESATQASANAGGAPVGIHGGDRFGNTLAILSPCNGNTPNRELNEVTAIWSPGGYSNEASAAQSVPEVNFLQGSADITADNLSPFYTQGGTGLTRVTTKAGASAVFVKTPRVKVFASGGSGSVSGTLYVQRQHSIEIR